MTKKQIPLKAAVLSSGGKDGIMAYYKTLQKGHKVAFLVNLFHNDNVCYHHINKKFVKLQAKAIGLKIIQKKIVNQHKNINLFEKNLFHIIADLKKHGIELLSVAYMSTHDYQHKLLKSICDKLELQLFNPYLRKTSKNVLKEIIKLKIKPIITSIDPNRMGREWLGHIIDENFFSHISSNPNIDQLGDKGEYHTFVLDAPFFLKKINISKSSKHISSSGEHYLQIDQYSLVKTI